LRPVWSAPPQQKVGLQYTNCSHFLLNLLVCMFWSVILKDIEQTLKSQGQWHDTVYMNENGI